MFRIDIVNTQAIGEAHITFNENSIVEFIGDNSNGKSVLGKVIEALTKNELKDKEARHALIKDGQEMAVILFTYKEKQLGIVLHRELSQSVVIYYPERTNEEHKFVRSVSDTEGVKALIHEFGFRVYDRGNICLQLSPTFGAIPFITTGGAANYDIVQDITTDKVADEFLKAFKNITFPVFKDKLKQMKTQKNSLELVLSNLEQYDWRAYEKAAEDLKEIYDGLLTIDYFSEVKSITIPDFDWCPMFEFRVRSITIPEYIELFKPVQPLGDTLDRYITLMNGKCPTCGRLFAEGA